MPGSRTFTFLGTGTSVGVPMVGCECSVCRSTNPRNKRYRCSALVRTAGGNILIDTPPELRLQLLRENVSIVHAVLFTHYHADHLFGLDDLRPFPLKLGHAMPLYCSDEVEEVIRRAFAYAFPPGGETPSWVPRLVFKRIDPEQPFEVLGQEVVPIPLIHSIFNVFGFRFDNVAYCTDVNHIPETSWPLLEGLDVLIIDALRYKPHTAHFTVDEALEVIDRLRPEKAYLTHTTHDIDYEELSARLPANVEIAYDGLSFDF